MPHQGQRVPPMGLLQIPSGRPEQPFTAEPALPDRLLYAELSPRHVDCCFCMAASYRLFPAHYGAEDSQRSRQPL